MLLAALAACKPDSPANAQEKPYPSAPVRFIVGAPPGGPIDLVPRLISQYLPNVIGQPGVIENRPGAGTVIATRAVVAAAPDGLTVLSAANSMLATQKANSKAGYDVERDLIPVLTVGWMPNIIVAAPSLPVTTLRDVMELARTRNLNYGTIGVGTTTHLMTDYLFRNAGLNNVQHVVYGGSSPALAAVAGNQLELASVAMVAAVPLVKSNQLKGLVLTSNRRVTTLPDVPTLAEAGFPGQDYVTWVGLFMPAKTPEAIVNRFSQAARQVLAMPEVKEKLAGMSFEPETVSGAEFRDKVSIELKHWSRVVEATGVKID